MSQSLANGIAWWSLQDAVLACRLPSNCSSVGALVAARDACRAALDIGCAPHGAIGLIDRGTAERLVDSIQLRVVI